MSTINAAWGPSGPLPLAGTVGVDLRLTRRGRLARSASLLALVLLLALSIADVLGGSLARAADPQVAPAPISTLSVVVADGDSLWAIAERTAPDIDPREVVQGIRELNGMRSNTIHPGQVLLLPQRS